MNQETTTPSASPASSHLLVVLQFSAIALGVIPWGNGASPLWLIASVIGGVVGVYTLMHNKLGNFGVYPEPVDGAQLITSGPYRWVRHPMYLSLILFMLGIVMFNAAIGNYLALVLLLIAIIGKMNKEEVYLSTQFDGYKDYQTCSKRLFPLIY